MNQTGSEAPQNRTSTLFCQIIKSFMVFTGSQLRDLQIRVCSGFLITHTHTHARTHARTHAHTHTHSSPKHVMHPEMDFYLPGSRSARLGALLLRLSWAGSSTPGRQTHSERHDNRAGWSLFPHISRSC